MAEALEARALSEEVRASVLYLQGRLSRRRERSPDRELGVVKRWARDGFGFITCPNDEELFFHFSEIDGGEIERLLAVEGVPVSFARGSNEKGPRAEDIRVEVTDEQRSAILQGRSGAVATLQNAYCFVADSATGGRVFVHKSSFEDVSVWEHLRIGDKLVIDIEASPRGPLAVPGSVKNQGEVA